MTSHPEPQTLAAPSRSTLAKTTLIALLVAGVVLVTLVLPAEYAIDPVGTGQWLGLTQIAAPTVIAVDVVTPDGAPLVPTRNGPIGEYPREFKYDVLEIELEPYDYIEYKYRLEKDATMLYSWTATAGVRHDFHGERSSEVTDGGPPEQSFDTADKRQSTGSYTAPFSGIHGWYWENPGGERITIRLTTAGFYESPVEIRSDRTRQTRTLRPLDSLSGTPTTPAPAASQ